MSEALVIEEVAVDDLSAGEVLDRARSRRAAADRAEAELLELAAVWADLHPPESIHDAAEFTGRGCEHGEPIAGPGCPLVAEFCLAELGACLGVSTTTAKRLVGHALELRHRLPRLWAAVHAGRVSPWRARAVAEATIHAHPALTAEAARWVDAQAAAVAGKVGPAQLDRLVAEAITRHHLSLPADPLDPTGEFADHRHVTVETGQVSHTGTTLIAAEVDLVDALDLDHALTTGAAALKALGSTAGLDARRAMALGDLARTQTALDLAAGGRPDTDTGTTADARDGRDRLPAARQLVLHVHLSAAALGSQGLTLDALARLERGQHLLLLDQIRSWCGDSHTTVTIRPVLDLATEITAPGYTPTGRQREHVVLRDRTCVFPWCTRPARSCDLDHVVPYDHAAATEGRPQPGPTSTSNLAPLCRRHHRLKTHGRWRVRSPEPGTYIWTSPHGHEFTRDPDGTSHGGPDHPDEHEEPDVHEVPEGPPPPPRR